MKQEYTIRNAVFDTLFEMPKNTDFYFTDFLSEVGQGFRLTATILGR